MNTNWLLTMKPSFNAQWLDLPPKESHQIHEKITLLTRDPTPDAKVKKQLKYMDGKLHRIRSGDYRIFYTFERPYISLLALRRRSDDTYEEDLDAEFLGGFNPPFDETTKAVLPSLEQNYTSYTTEKRLLPKRITEELLTNLLVPTIYHSKLIPLQTEDELLNISGIPNDVWLKLIEHLFPRPLGQIVQQDDYVVPHVDDLLRIRRGEYLNFLLRLSPEQEQASSWAKNAAGPTQVTGRPGTGKSIVALYRVKSIVEKLRREETLSPTILFTTYTKALVESSRQLLQQLLGEDIKYVKVETADSIVWSILKDANVSLTIAGDTTLLVLVKKAIVQAQAENYTQQQTIARLSPEYVLEEICQVIIARKIPDSEAYKKMKRDGRKVGLLPGQREALWNIYEILCQSLKKMRQESWQQARIRAETVLSSSKNIHHYDAVIVDEAQDLDPGVIRILFRLCKAENRFFITADANQSIYRTGFTWRDVHESLRFQGRTTKLKTNYRSTRQIGEAAQSYLATVDTGDADITEWQHKKNGYLPEIRMASNLQEEIQILKLFLPTAAHEFQLGISSCAILCPTKSVGIEIAKGLREHNIEAIFMTRENINLLEAGVKIMTLHSSKGLEFPVVALAGFNNSRYASISEVISLEEQPDITIRDRRTLYVGMTRAMHALLVVVPRQTTSPLFTGFDTTLWHLGG